MSILFQIAELLADAFLELGVGGARVWEFIRGKKVIKVTVTVSEECKVEEASWRIPLQTEVSLS